MSVYEYPVINTVATGKRIRELRRENHMRVTDLMDFMGLESVQAIYKWQRGESLPSVDNLFALSRLFGIPMDDILMEQEKEEAQASSDHFKLRLVLGSVTGKNFSISLLLKTIVKTVVFRYNKAQFQMKMIRQGIMFRFEMA